MAPERVVLPTNVTPVHYNLKLFPNLETFVFTGEVAIKYEIVLQNTQASQWVDKDELSNVTGTHTILFVSSLLQHQC